MLIYCDEVYTFSDHLARQQENPQIIVGKEEDENYNVYKNLTCSGILKSLIYQSDIFH